MLKTVQLRIEDPVAPRRLPVGAAMPFDGFNALHDAAEEP
jgi:hypothetical protein